MTAPVVGAGEGAVGYEPRDTRVAPVLMFGVALFLMLLLVLTASALLLTYATAQREGRSRDVPLPAMSPPRPRLESDAAADLAEARRAEDQRLHSYAWIDRSAGVVRIPIDRAMDLLAAEAARSTSNSGNRAFSNSRGTQAGRQ